MVNFDIMVNTSGIDHNVKTQTFTIFGVINLGSV